MELADLHRSVRTASVRESFVVSDWLSLCTCTRQVATLTEQLVKAKANATAAEDKVLAVAAAAATAVAS